MKHKSPFKSKPRPTNVVYPPHAKRNTPDSSDPYSQETNHQEEDLLFLQRQQEMEKEIERDYTKSNWVPCWTDFGDLYCKFIVS